MDKLYHLPIQLSAGVREEFDDEPFVYVDDDIDEFLERTREEVRGLSGLQEWEDEAEGRRRQRRPYPLQVQ